MALLKKYIHSYHYALGDFLAALIAWILYFWIHRVFAGETFQFNLKFIAGLILAFYFQTFRFDFGIYAQSATRY